MKNDVRAKGEGLTEIGRCKGGIDHERHSLCMRHLADCRDIQHFKTRIAQRLTEKQPRLRRDRRGEGIGIAWVNKSGRDAKAWQRVLEEVMGAAVK